MSDLDLDALAPQPKTIKFQGQEYTINPPQTAMMLRLGQLGQKMADMDTLQPEELEALAAQMVDMVSSCVEDLPASELTTSQLLAVLGVITEMGTPPDTAELKKRGIEPAIPKAQ